MADGRRVQAHWLSSRGWDAARIARRFGVSERSVFRWLRADPPPVAEAAPAWMDDALCRETGSDLFYTTHRGRHLGEAFRVCQLCDVRAECLDWAISHNEQFGVWGGKSPLQRQEIKRQRRRKGIA